MALRCGAIVLAAAFCLLPAFAGDRAADLASVAEFDRAIRSRLLDARARHTALRAALADASYEETLRALAAEEKKDRQAARAVEAMRVPAGPSAYATGLESAKRHAVGALEARSDRNERLAAVREKGYFALADGILARLKETR